MLEFSSKNIVAEQGQKRCQVRVIRQKYLPLPLRSQLSFLCVFAAWEKRTDISTAINVATKKKIPKLVQELKVKLDALPQVSHTTVLKRKEEHLASKALKSDLHKLANRRFGRAQEVSTERVIAVMSLWAKRRFFFFLLYCPRTLSFYYIGHELMHISSTHCYKMRSLLPWRK